jgi:hypothetical protein
MNMLSTAPQAGAILWALLPEEGSARKAKERPVIVLDVSERDGFTYLTVAKGTSQKTDMLYRGEFAITDSLDIASCGLSEPTKFQLCRYETLLFTTDWFNTKLPRVLPQHLLRKLINAAQEAGHI